ncbi:MAG: BRCT domain-containing protein, partial [Patescibacteria group bacterium]
HPDAIVQSRKTELSGKNVVITGTLLSFSRDGAKDAVKRAGGKVQSAVSSKTDLVVVGEDAGSKAKKAQELGVRTIDEQAFISMLG